ncbi:NAD(P)-dependent dehydrogenase (short-subunit alcohol dehydrogenase family) [Comamonas sp. BIGb0152]|uniref:SDR family oxidoreductase n=1 Tax=Comamonas sp. BIGb0152 TaxID=2940601 RepID=UPI002169FCF1|nr:SDR family oxidoreductase [Comamonas sp. BIGb0152]MCS4295779.1 NAD(P)-dependent dehydrogenase (short-subunit alcohol dehydrogenase family) [Comamonas sp. BIGb0152]
MSPSPRKTKKPSTQPRADKRSVDEVVAAQQRIQQQQTKNDARDKAAKAPKKTKGSQDEKSRKKTAPGPGHAVPTPPMPAKKLAKPGQEKALDLQPLYLAENYQGSGKLEGKTAVITGGDSGIGRAVAVLFAREGANVAILYLNEHDDAKQTCRLIEDEGRQSLAISGNVQDPQFCEKAVKQVLKKFGALNVLVNNAAFQQHAADIEDLNTERLDETFRTNIFGYFHMVKAAIPYLQRGDAIVNTGSVTGLRGSKQLLDYSATKGAIHAFTKALAQNLMERGIRVNAVAPGPVWTPLNPADKSGEDLRQFGADTQMGRPAQPEELAPAYVFLASQVCSSYISGIVLPVTGSVGES